MILQVQTLQDVHEQNAQEARYHCDPVAVRERPGGAPCHVIACSVLKAGTAIARVEDLRLRAIKDS